MITEALFLAATGSVAEDDDLERSNCPKAGQIGHSMCGWNVAANLPVFMAGHMATSPTPTAPESTE